MSKNLIMVVKNSINLFTKSFTVKSKKTISNNFKRYTKMKKIYLIFLLSIALFTKTYSQCYVDAGNNVSVDCGQSVQLTASAPEWNEVTSTATLTDIQAINSSTIYGMNNYNIYKSSDQGSNWTQQFNTAVLLQGFSLNSNTGVAVGYNNSTGYIYYTSNGTDWVMANSFTSKKFWDVQMVSSTTGYVIGSSGLWNGILMKTTFSGTVWNEVVTFPGSGFSLSDLYFIDENTGFICGQYATGKIWKTTDAGTNWTEITKTSDNIDFKNLYTIYAVNSNIIIAAGAQAVYRSADAGITWTKVSDDSFADYYQEISFYDENNGYIVGQGATILKTSDAGQTWQNTYLSNYSGFNDVHFISSETGYISTTNSKILRKNLNDFLWSPADGLNYTNIANPVATPSQTTIYTVSYSNQFGCTSSDEVTVNFNTVEVSAFGSQIICGGSTQLFANYTYGGPGTVIYDWNNSSSLSSSNIYNPVASPTETTTYTVTATIQGTECSDADNVTVYVENLEIDLQESYNTEYLVPVTLETNIDEWQTKLVYPTDYFDIVVNDLYFIDENIGFAVSNYGVIMKTFDGGNLWLPGQSPTENDLNAVWFINESVGFVAGNECFYKTTTGGDIWYQVTGLVNYNFKDIVFCTESIGFVYANNNLYRTTDAGETWSSVYLDINTTILDLQFIPNSAIGYIMTYKAGMYTSSTLYKTTNNGQNWNVVYDFSPTLSSVYFTDENTGYVAGDYYRKTTDGGQTWNPFTINDANPTIRDLYFKDSQNGIALSEYQILRTYDGAQTWIEEQNNNFEDSYKNIYSAGNTNEFITGSNGTIFKYSEPVYEWTNPENLSAYNIPNPVCTPEYDTYHQVFVTTNELCTANASTWVYLNFPCESNMEFENISGNTFNFSLSDSELYPEEVAVYWEFSDGSSEFGKNIEYTFAGDGVYSVVLTISHPNGCASSSKASVVAGEPEIGCVSNFDYIVTDNTVTFTDKSMGSDLNYMWYFDDGEFSVEENPVHNYTVEGNYDVCLGIYTTDNSCFDIKCNNVKIGDTDFPHASFVYTTNTENTEVDFFGQYDTRINKYSWNFGDGTTAEGRVVNHNYTETGYYIIEYKIENTENGFSDTKYDLINAGSGNNGIQTDFNYILDSVLTKNYIYSIEFQEVSFGRANKYIWDFGDGEKDSTTLYPNHVYTEEGNYNVCLTAIDYQTLEQTTICKEIKLGNVTNSVAENKIENPKIYPNPASNYIQIAYNFGDNTKIEIIDATGRILTTSNYSGNGNNIISLNIQEYKSGIYFVKINTDNKIYLKKIIVNK